MSERTEKLRKQFNRLRDRGELAEHCGTVCVSCGAMEAIDYHHILPLVMGGDNRYSNIVPLCCVCHDKIHGHNMTRLMRWSDKTGRPKDKAPKGYEEISMAYMRGTMTEADAKKKLGMMKNTRLTERWWFAELMEKEGIAFFKKSASRWETKIVSRIWYKNGDYEEIDGKGQSKMYRGRYTEAKIKEMATIKKVYRPDIKIVAGITEDVRKKA